MQYQTLISVKFYNFWLYAILVGIAGFIGSVVTSSILYCIFDDKKIEQKRKEATITLLFFADEISSILVSLLSFWMRGVHG